MFVLGYFPSKSFFRWTHNQSMPRFMHLLVESTNFPLKKQIANAF